MSILNTKPVTQQIGKPLWIRALSALGSAGAGALAVVLALAFFPAAFELASDVLAPAISSAIASDNGNAAAPKEFRRHRLTDARAAQHGSYVSDPYGCLYMFQYLDAKLSLTPVLDDQRQPLCPR